MPYLETDCNREKNLISSKDIPTNSRSLFLASDNREEHVESNLDGIDKDQSVLRGDELEVDSVHNGPDLPRSLTRTVKVGLDLVNNNSDRVTVYQAQIGEENSHEDGAP
jgi:hypothetical protein